MAVLTKYLLAEQSARIIHGGDIGVSSEPSIATLKVVVGQVINKMLKIDYMSTNFQMGEFIQNGAVLGLYENISVTSYNGKSKSTLPIKPLKLPRNMGVFSVYPKYETNGNVELDKEFIPLQMGQGGLLKSQALISDLMGQVGYEVFGNDVIYNTDLKSLHPNITVSMRLAIMDIDQYDDWDMLPLPPEMQADVVNAVVAMYKQQGTPDKTVDPAVSEQKDVPISQQRMT